MKRTIILTLMAFVPALASAQTTNFDIFFDKYTAREGFTTVEITGEMLNLLNGMAGQKSKKNSSEYDGIDYIKLVVAEAHSDTFTEELKKLPGEEHQLMSSVTEKGQNVSIYYRQKSETNQKEDFLMIIYGKENNLALNITGEIDVKKISGLAGLRITGMNSLYDLNKSKSVIILEDQDISIIH